MMIKFRKLRQFLKSLGLGLGSLALVLGGTYACLSVRASSLSADMESNLWGYDQRPADNVYIVHDFHRLPGYDELAEFEWLRRNSWPEGFEYDCVYFVHRAYAQWTFDSASQVWNFKLTGLDLCQLEGDADEVADLLYLANFPFAFSMAVNGFGPDYNLVQMAPYDVLGAHIEDVEAVFSTSTAWRHGHIQTTVNLSGSFDSDNYWIEPNDTLFDKLEPLFYPYFVAADYGLNASYADGYNDGYSDGKRVGEQSGYTQGYQDASESINAVMASFTGLFGAVVNVPIGVLNGLTPLAFFNVPVISVIITFLFIGLLLWVVRKLI